MYICEISKPVLLNLYWKFTDKTANCEDPDEATHYRIYLAMREGFVSLERRQVSKSVLWNFAIIRVLPFLNNPKELDPSNKDLDPSNKMDLDLWDCFGRKKKTPSYNQRNTVWTSWSGSVLSTNSSSGPLTLKVPITTAADDIHKYLFHHFSEKIRLDISCESSA